MHSVGMLEDMAGVGQLEDTPGSGELNKEGHLVEEGPVLVGHLGDMVGAAEM